ERCHRLAILDRGRLVAEGTPAGLTAGIEQRVLAIDCARPRDAQALLRDSPGIDAIAQIGTTLRVLAARALDAEALRARLSNAGIEARVAEIPPNLEDVFVAATRRMRTPEAA
ncbi:MAG TPA: ABC transporter ATP-binding protein, partial [Candidatus Saccharimonadia bacterium]|nr:ABC transporter ATP-binding protein [Candidatus Saccharimonadia bacterium]